MLEVKPDDTITFSNPEGWGDITFSTPGCPEFLHLKSDGQALVRGELVATNKGVYDAFCEWFFTVRNW